MAQQLLIGNEKASVFRGKLNDNYTELYGRMTYFYGWGYQDFDAGVINGTSVTITANSNGTGFTFDAANLTITNSAAIVRVADIDTVPYTGTTTLFSSKVKATAQTGASVTLSGVPHASWGACRIYYYYKYDKVPTGYTAAPGFISAQKLDALDTSFVTDDVYNAGIANFVSTDNIFTIDYSLVATDGTTGRKIRQGLATTNSDGDINIPTGRTYKINNLPILNSNLVSGSAGVAGYLFTGNGTTTAPSWSTVYSAIATTPTTNYLVKFGATKLENSLIYETTIGLGFNTNNPVSKFHFNNSSTDPTGSNVNIRNVNKLTLTSNNTNTDIGWLNLYTLAGTGNFNASFYRAGSTEIYHAGSGSASLLVGHLYSGGITGSGNVSSFKMVSVETYGPGSGVVSNLYGLHVENLNLYNTPTNTYGVYVANNTSTNGTSKYGLYVGNISGASSSNWSIYTGTAPSRFGGNVAIGTTDLDGTPPIGRLTVKGLTNDGTTNALVLRDSDEANILSVNTNGDLIGIGSQESAKVKQTIEGGIAIKLTNKTGANSVKGTVVYADPSVDNAFEINPIDGDMPIGVVYESGIADGSECWVVVSGIAEVLLVNTVASTRSHIAYSSASVAGRIDTAASAPAANLHFREIGHTLESKVGGTDVLCKCVLHFN